MKYIILLASLIYFWRGDLDPPGSNESLPSLEIFARTAVCEVLASETKSGSYDGVI